MTDNVLDKVHGFSEGISKLHRETRSSSVQDASFKNIMEDRLNEVNSRNEAQELMNVETKDINEMVRDMDEAKESFAIMKEVREQLVEAYQELKGMNL